MRRMMFRYESDLPRGLAASIDNQMKFDQWVGSQGLRQRDSRIVVTNGPHKNATRTDGYQITGDVACPTNHQLAAFYRNDWRWGFRRNTRDIAIDELIQHQITDTKNGLFGERG